MFSLLNVKWGEPVFGEPSGTVTWSPGIFVDGGPDDSIEGFNLASGTTDGEINSALNAAFNAWENVAAIDFVRVSGDADITFSAGSLGGNIAGLATVFSERTDGLSRILEGEIEFSSDLNWSNDGSGGVNFFAVALHEIGHAIGLNHVDDRSQIMNDVVFANDLGDGDIAGAQFIYGTDGGDDVIDDIPPPSDDGGGADDVNVVGDGGGGGGGGGAGAAGLIVALLALVIGIFSGGAGGGAAVAAGRVPLGDKNEDDDVAAAEENHHDQHDHVEILPDGTTAMTHTTYVSEMPLPMIDFGAPPVTEEDDELEDEFFI